MKRNLVKSDSENERKQMLDSINGNLSLLKKVGEEIEQRMKENGGDHMKATLEVMEKYEAELEKLINK